MSTKARNDDIVRRHLAGENLAEIGRIYGITRERVRQIISNRGCISSQERVKEERSIIAGAVQRRNLTAAEAAQMFNCKISKVYDACRENGVEVPKYPSEKQARIDEAVEYVRAGMSYNKAAKLCGMSQPNVEYHCKNVGVRSRARSRHKDLSKRYEFLPKWREEGLTWLECTERMSAIENAPLKVMSLYSWVGRHMPELMSTTREPKRNVSKAKPAKKLTTAEIQFRETVKETAIANYGKASASEIAESLGVTRNSIIGYWFRARQAGDIAA